nr:vegetative cell wall protein gp1-like [Aegilops tauschii subsp. strangulata]
MATTPPAAGLRVMRLTLALPCSRKCHRRCCFISAALPPSTAPPRRSGIRPTTAPRRRRPTPSPHSNCPDAATPRRRRPTIAARRPRQGLLVASSSRSPDSIVVVPVNTAVLVFLPKHRCPRTLYFPVSSPSPHLVTALPVASLLPLHSTRAPAPAPPLTGRSPRPVRSRPAVDRSNCAPRALPTPLAPVPLAISASPWRPRPLPGHPRPSLPLHAHVSPVATARPHRAVAMATTPPYCWPTHHAPRLGAPVQPQPSPPLLLHLCCAAAADCSTAPLWSPHVTTSTPPAARYLPQLRPALPSRPGRHSPPPRPVPRANRGIARTH